MGLDGARRTGARWGCTSPGKRPWFAETGPSSKLQTHSWGGPKGHTSSFPTTGLGRGFPPFKTGCRRDLSFDLSWGPSPLSWPPSALQDSAMTPGGISPLTTVQSVSGLPLAFTVHIAGGLSLRYALQELASRTDAESRSAE